MNTSADESSRISGKSSYSVDLVSLLTQNPAVRLALVYALFALLAPASFTSWRNLELIFCQTTIVGVVALGLTPVIVTGGIDMAVGSVVALTTVVMAGLLKVGIPPVLVLLLGVLTGAACGRLHGYFVARLRMDPFITTLITMLVFRGVAMGMAHEQKIDAPETWLNEMLSVLKPEQAWLLLPPGVWVFGMVALVLHLALSRATFGLQVTAVGSNEKAAHLKGVQVEKIKMAVYTLCGLGAGLGGVFQFARLRVGDPTVAGDLALDAIAAVVIGGASLSGGRGGVPGTIIGAFLMTIIRSGCVQLGVPNWTQMIITGTIIWLGYNADKLSRRGVR